MSGGVLLYADAKSIERNDAYGSFFSSPLADKVKAAINVQQLAGHKVAFH
jgi:hypothetical protein